ncbi:MAG TPA: pitrilysin family protein [bacterium]|nr:pitrilysin family protein [bacterium]
MSSRLFLAAAALLAVAAVATSATAADIPDIPHEFYTLDNGLEVILHEDHSTPIVGINIWYHVGSKNEKPGRSGFAHLFEHMMFQGSEHQDREYFDPLHAVGGLVNGSTNSDRTNYWEIVPANHLKRALILEADRMGYLLPAMTQEKFENQQDVVRNERREGEGSPYSSYRLSSNENLYPKGHPYDHSVIGIHEDLEAATLEDVKDFFRTYYTPNNATLSVSGDFDPAQAKEWIAAYFGPIPPGPPVEEFARWIPELSSEKRVRAQEDVQLARTYYVWHTPPYYAEGDADMDLAAKILGQGSTSRLYRRLVHEEKLVQEVTAWQTSKQLSSTFTVSLTFRPGADAAEAERILDEEIARLAKSGPTDEELTRAKTVFEAGFVQGIQNIGSWGGKNDRLNRYNHYLGTPDYFRQDYERFMNRTAETVRTQVARWLGPGRLVHEITPFGSPSAVATADVDYTEMPAGDAEPTMTAPTIHRRTLPNGLRLAVLEQHELPLVRLDLTFRGGTAADPAGQGGLADVSGEMLLEGTAKKDKFEYRSALEGLGTNLGVMTQPDYTTVWMQSLRKALDESVALMAEAVLRPAFPETELADQKERRLNNLRRERDDPRTIAAKATGRILFGEDHPYAGIGSGTETSIAALTTDDVRAFAGENFTPGNATIVAVGDITVDELEKVVRKHLGDWSGDAPDRPAVTAGNAPEGRTIYLIDKPGDSQSTISVAQPGIPRSSSDWEAVFVANRVLGGFFSSRLNLNLREDKGYTYGARSFTWERKGPSVFTMGARVQTEVTAEALTEFLAELEGISGGNPISAEELDFAKGSVLGGYYREFETIGQLADAVREQVIFGLPDDNFARYPDKVRTVDLDTANRAASSHFNPDDIAIIVVGDLAKIEDPIRALDLGPIRYADRNGVVREEQELSSR